MNWKRVGIQVNDAILITEPALADLHAIRDYIAEQSLDNAALVINRLYEAIQFLTDNPKAGHTRAEIEDLGIRAWPESGFIILYRTDSKPLQVIRIVHGSRDFRRLRF